MCYLDLLERKSDIVCSPSETGLYLPETNLETSKSLWSASESEINLGDKLDHYIIAQQIFSFLQKCPYYVFFFFLQNEKEK